MHIFQCRQGFENTEPHTISDSRCHSIVLCGLVISAHSESVLRLGRKLPHQFFVLVLKPLGRSGAASLRTDPIKATEASNGLPVQQMRRQKGRTQGTGTPQGELAQQKLCVVNRSRARASRDSSAAADFMQSVLLSGRGLGF